MLTDPEGKVLAAEVKLGGTVSHHDLRHLKWLTSKYTDRVIDRIVITTGPIAYRRPDGIAIVPLALLGPARSYLCERFGDASLLGSDRHAASFP